MFDVTDLGEITYPVPPMGLIVDDHIDTCRALLHLLKREGIPAECVDDPTAALQVIDALRPRLVVLDQMMPGLRGTDVLRALRGTPTLANIPAIFYSAAEDGREEAHRLGALAWITKGGTTWNELRQKIISAYNAHGDIH